MRAAARGALGAAGLALGTAACSLFANLDQYEGGGSVDAGGDAGVDGACGETMSSQTSCGACGHDCQGAICSNGICAQETVTSDMTSGFPVSLSIDNASAQLFWADAFSAFKSCSIDGGAFVSTPLPSVGAGGQGVLSLGVGPSSVFVTTAEGAARKFQSHLYRVARSSIGTTGAVVDEIASGADVNHLIDFVHADSTAVIWGVRDGAGPTAGSIESAAPDAAPSSGGTPLQASARPHALAITADSLIWIDRAAEVSSTKVGSVVVAPRPTGTMKLIVVGAIPFDLLAATSTDAYFAWSDGTTTSLRRASLDGKTLSDVVSNVSFSGDVLATDGTTLAWSTVDAQATSITLVVCTLATSCADALPVATLPITARGTIGTVTLAVSAAVGGDWLYWAEPGTQRIQRVSIQRH